MSWYEDFLEKLDKLAKPEKRIDMTLKKDHTAILKDDESTYRGVWYHQEKKGDFIIKLYNMEKQL